MASDMELLSNQNYALLAALATQLPQYSFNFVLQILSWILLIILLILLLLSHQTSFLRN
jgi:hypothetical protein